ncbi:MAG: hypothetical protein MHPSP_004855, partial [Paramarteilia canceri]
MKAILIILSIINVLCVKYYDITYIYEFDYYADNDEKITYEKYLDINYYNNRENKKIERCPDGKTSENNESEYKDICTKCTIFYKYENSINGPDCIKCPDGQIASFENGHNKTL